jgi:hypothetical protein
LAFGVRV